MTIKNIIGVLISGLFVLNACDLERYPESALSDAIYWQSENDFEQACNFLYSSFLPKNPAAVSDDYFLADDKMSDNAMEDSPNSISNGTYLPSANFGPWNSKYGLIRAANKIIEQAGESDINYEVLSRYIAEARFFRAYAYYDLVRRYGNVPLILNTLNIDDEELYLERTHREIVIDTVYNDLDYAAKFLPARSELYENVSKEYGRLTSEAALAFKSRVALREGTWNKFHSTANTSHEFSYHLNLAKEAASAVIESNEYQLFSDYETDSYKYLFKEEGNGPDNNEAIFVIRFGFNYDNSVRTNNYSLQVSRGFLSTTRSLVDSYLCIDGLPIDKSPLYQGQINANSEFIDRDSRLDGILVQKGEEYVEANSLQTDPYIPTIRSSTGYLVEKYCDEQAGYIDHMVIRYAEVLLNYAEATYELNEEISDTDLNISINLLRERAGVAHLSNAFVVSNELDMREEIRRERRVELALEGFRYDDLLRWKTAENELPKALEGVRYFAGEYVDTDVATLNLTPDSILIAEPASQRSFDPSMQYLWPLPLNQISLNPNLEQNPNW